MAPGSLCGLRADFRSWTWGSISKEENHKYGPSSWWGPPGPQALLAPPSASSSPTSLRFQEACDDFDHIDGVEGFFQLVSINSTFFQIFLKLF